ncbi:MAG: hypothetical protein U5N86_01420 [Planctomycetota bacterium]|nr:hypothetical protein [Planctomycetota bacterium]
MNESRFAFSGREVVAVSVVLLAATLVLGISGWLRDDPSVTMRSPEPYSYSGELRRCAGAFGTADDRRTDGEKDNTIPHDGGAHRIGGNACNRLGFHR